MNIDDIWKFDLRHGNSDHPRNGACLLDAVSWFAYGKLGDHPECACPVITKYAIIINDTLPDGERQKLKPFIFRLMGSRDPASEQARAEYLAWQAITVFAPLALDAAGVEDQAAKLRGFDKSLGLNDAAYAARAAYAAYAAGAARAARAAADAAAAARAAARAADYAADAAAYAADAARAHKEAINTLDGVLKIGKQSSEPDIAAVREAVEAFERARELA